MSEPGFHGRIFRHPALKYSKIHKVFSPFLPCLAQNPLRESSPTSGERISGRFAAFQRKVGSALRGRKVAKISKYAARGGFGHLPSGYVRECVATLRGAFFGVSLNGDRLFILSLSPPQPNTSTTFPSEISLAASSNFSRPSGV